MQHQLTHFVLSFWGAGLGAIFFLFLAGLLLEVAAPNACRLQTGRNRLFNLGLTFNFQLFDFVTSAALATFVASVAQKMGAGLISLRFSDGGGLLKAIALVILWGLVFDFFYYWFHRLQHTSRILWQEHALHHSDECVNVTTTLRHHLLENPLRALFISIPMAILFRLPIITVPVVWIFFRALSDFKHLNVRLNLGPFTPVIVGPQLHRVHHSCLKQHADRNFAAFFPVYDLVFGTYYRPGKNEYPPTGLQTGERQFAVLAAYWKPFHEWARMWRDRKTKLRQTAEGTALQSQAAKSNSDS